MLRIDSHARPQTAVKSQAPPTRPEPLDLVTVARELEQAGFRYQYYPHWHSGSPRPLEPEAAAARLSAGQRTEVNVANEHRVLKRPEELRRLHEATLEENPTVDKLDSLVARGYHFCSGKLYDAYLKVCAEDWQNFVVHAPDGLSYGYLKSADGLELLDHLDGLPASPERPERAQALRLLQQSQLPLRWERGWSSWRANSAGVTYLDLYHDSLPDRIELMGTCSVLRPEDLDHPERVAAVTALAKKVRDLASPADALVALSQPGPNPVDELLPAARFAWSHPEREGKKLFHALTGGEDLSERLALARQVERLVPPAKLAAAVEHMLSLSQEKREPYLELLTYSHNPRWAYRFHALPPEQRHRHKWRHCALRNPQVLWQVRREVGASRRVDRERALLELHGAFPMEGGRLYRRLTARGELSDAMQAWQALHRVARDIGLGLDAELDCLQRLPAESSWSEGVELLLQRYQERLVAGEEPARALQRALGLLAEPAGAAIELEGGAVTIGGVRLPVRQET